MGISQTEAAALIDIPVPTFREYESGATERSESERERALACLASASPPAERASFVTCYECGAEMPDDAYARAFGRCARHADEEKQRRLDVTL